MTIVESEVLLVSNQAWVVRLSFLIRGLICFLILWWRIFLPFTFSFLLASWLLLRFSFVRWNNIYLGRRSHRRIGWRVLGRRSERSTRWFSHCLWTGRANDAINRMILSTESGRNNILRSWSIWYLFIEHARLGIDEVQNIKHEKFIALQSRLCLWLHPLW